MINVNEAVIALAESVASILVDRNCNKAVAMSETFEQFGDYLKSDALTFDGDSGTDAPPRSAGHTAAKPRPNDVNDQSVLDPKLEAMVAAVMALPPTHHGYNAEGQAIVTPSMNRAEALHFLMRTPHGRAFAQHHANITKGISMPNTAQELVTFVKRSSDGMARVAKYVIDNKEYPTYSEAEFSTALMTFANLNKRDGETREKAFARILDEGVDPYDANHDIYRALNVVKGYPDPMPTEPDIYAPTAPITAADTQKVYEQVMAMARKLRETSPALSVQQAFARIMEQNPDLAARAHRRPTASSPGPDYLER